VPTLVLIHGLEGCDRSGYVLSAGDLAYRRGFHVVRMNMRGCGDALTICPRLYNAGTSTDLLAVLERLTSEASHISICGFSLGANLLLLTLARHRAVIPSEVGACAAISPPLDLAAAADAIGRTRNRLYQIYFLLKLKRSYRLRQNLLPSLYAAGQAQGVRSIREYDDAVVAPYGGFGGADDYYARSSSGPMLTSINRPTLILAADDDPMIPQESVTHWPISPVMTREMTPTGGHVGFVGKTRAPGWFWAAERAFEFIREHGF
jgi:predicted alpha/beta-fold hydrolase